MKKESTKKSESQYEQIQRWENQKSTWIKDYEATIRQGKMMRDFLWIPDQQSSTIEKQTKRVKGRSVVEMNWLKTAQGQIESEFMQAAPQVVILPASQETPQELVNIKAGIYRDICYESKADDVNAKCFVDALTIGFSAQEVVVEYEKPGSLKKVLRHRKPKDALMCFWDRNAKDPTKVDGAYAGYEQDESVAYLEQEYPNGDFSMYQNKDTDTAIVTYRYQKNFKRTRWYWVEGFDKQITKKEYDRFVKVDLPALNELAEKRYYANIENRGLDKESMPPFIPVQAPIVKHKETSLDWDIEWICYHQKQILARKTIPIKTLPLIFWPGNTKVVGNHEIALPFVIDATVPQQIYNQTLGQIMDEIYRAFGTRIMANEATIKNKADKWADLSNSMLLTYKVPPNENSMTACPKVETAPSFDPALLGLAQQMQAAIASILGRSPENMGGETNAHDFSSILLRKMAGDSAAGVWYMNAMQALQQIARTDIEWMPFVHDKEQNIRVRGKNGSHTYKKINVQSEDYHPNGQRVIDPKTGMPPIKNDMRSGEFSVEAIGGPSFAMQKLAGIHLMSKLLENPELFPILIDLFGEQLPFEWGNELSNRAKIAGLVNGKVVAHDEGKEYQPPPPTAKEKLAALGAVADIIDKKSVIAQAEAKTASAKIGAVGDLIESQEKLTTAISDSVKAFAEAPLPQISSAIEQLEEMSETTSGMIEQIEDQLNQGNATPE